MAWRIAFLTLVLGWCACAHARHSNAVLDPRRATPGVHLELVELSRSAHETPKYRLRASGLPSGTGFAVWTKSFGHDFEELAPALPADASGVLAVADQAGRRQRLDAIELDPGPYPRGAAWWVAIASEDHKIVAFARVVPYPIVAHDGPCSVSIELISFYGNRFIATGSGFPPGQNVDVEAQASGTVSRKRERVYADGALPLDVLEHGTLAADTVARYSIKARDCAPALEYRWGESALKND
jgi:hypothetical protein